MYSLNSLNLGALPLGIPLEPPDEEAVEGQHHHVGHDHEPQHHVPGYVEAVYHPHEPYDHCFQGYDNA